MSPQQKLLMKRLKRVRALFGFLRLHRDELFDDSFQEQLESMYRDTGAGALPHPPALLRMVVLLQGYLEVSDADAVEPSVVDLRWQTVLGCLGAEKSLFSQGALQAFRERMVARKNATEIGIIEASGAPRIEQLIAEFAGQAASVGGDIAKVDSVETGFEMETQSRQDSYSCGTTAQPRTCYRTVYSEVEVATMKVVGRAFKSSH